MNSILYHLSYCPVQDSEFTSEVKFTSEVVESAVKISEFYMSSLYKHQKIFPMLDYMYVATHGRGGTTHGNC